MSTIRTLEVVIKDFKKLKNITAEINGCNVFLRGPNGVGKSSFMDFIEIAFGKSKIVPPNTNIEGEVLVDKDGNRYLFSVKLDNKGKPKVTVRGPDGNKDTSKSVIAGIVGANAFDIDHFVNLSTTDAGRKQQVQEFKKFLDEETRDFLAKYEASVKANFDERTGVNREISKLEGSINLHPMINHLHELDKFEETKTEKLMAELKEIQAHNDQVNKVLNRVEQGKNEIDQANQKIKELEEQIAAIKSGMETTQEFLGKANEWLGENEIKPTDKLEQSIADAGKNNMDYSNAQNLKKELTTLQGMKQTATELTDKIESERQMIQDAIRDMEGPIQGLTFDDDQLLYNGIPVHPNSLSKSEIKRLGIRLKIAENPDLPLFIHEAECMDENSLREIQDLADECGLQMFVEEVKRGTKELQIEISAFN